MEIINKLRVYNIFHNKVFDELIETNDERLTMYGVNENIEKEFTENTQKYNVMFEYDLAIYEPIWQKKGYAQTSCLLHLFKNKLYEDLDYIGFLQYDMKINENFFTDLDLNINKAKSQNKLFIGYSSRICIDYILQWDSTLADDTPLSALSHYNKFFNANYTLKDIQKNFYANFGIIMLHTFVIPKEMFHKMMTWLSVYMEDIKDNFPSKHRPCDYLERCHGLFIALENLSNDNMIYENIGVSHEQNFKNLVKGNGYPHCAGGGEYEYKIKYGTPENNIDVTDIVQKKCLFYSIPVDKNELFGDPAYLQEKFLFISDGMNGKYVFNENQAINIDLNLNTVKAIIPSNLDYIAMKYNNFVINSSDINQHLRTLFKYAMECETIFETGVRGVISSWAFVYGLLNNNKPVKKLLMNDIDECNVDEILQATKNLKINVDYIWKNNLELDLEETFDLTFIDTWHVYGQLKRELDKFSKITKKYIILHDTTVDEWQGESLRRNMNVQEQSKLTGFPEEEIKLGLWPAIEEFLNANTNWQIHERFKNNNGLTILKYLG